tara:strand:- start:816 stop:1043 length:228 start_codon:yes stop_codon:yes gene_type:complete
MTKRIRGWGNSSGIRLPKTVLAEAELEKDDAVNIKVIHLENGEKGILVTSTDVDNNVVGFSQQRLSHILDKIKDY